MLNSLAYSRSNNQCAIQQWAMYHQRLLYTGSKPLHNPLHSGHMREKACTQKGTCHAWLGTQWAACAFLLDFS